MFDNKTFDTDDILSVTEFIYNNISSLRGTIEKQNELKRIYIEEPEITENILKIIYVNTVQFNLTPVNILKFNKNKKYNETEYNKYEHIYDLLNDLDSREITGYKALKSASVFIKEYEEYTDIIFMILKKNLEIRLNVKSINTILNNIIPEFKVVLAKKYDQKYLDKHNDSDWYLTRKYDGVRIIADINLIKKTIRYYTRVGKEDIKLDFLTKTLDFNLLKLRNTPNNFILDGEVIHMSNNTEDFKETMKLIKNPERNQKNLEYIIFDFLKPNEFYSGKGNIILSERFKNLYNYFGEYNGKFIPIQHKLYNPENLITMNNLVEKESWEGLMLRRDYIYEGKRTNDLQKIKKFEDEEFKVIDVLMSEIRFINKETLKEEKMNVLGSVIINFNDVRVGSGFSEEQRIYYYEHPEEIINKIITVQYFEKTPDNKLRFPVLKYIHGEKRNY